MPLTPFPAPARPEAASAASVAILMALIDTLIAKNVISGTDVIKMLSTTLPDLDAGSEPAKLVGRLMERVAATPG